MGGVWIILLLGSLIATYGLWLIAGPRSVIPPKPLSADITYERFWITSDAIAHLAIINLNNPCLEIITETPLSDGQVYAKTTSEFLKIHDADIAINASYFFPFREYPHWKTYPKSGDILTPLGAIVINQEIFGEGMTPQWDGGYLNFLQNGKVVVGNINKNSILAISGKEILALDGKPIDSADERQYPRTVIGVSNKAQKLYILAVDGKQLGYSLGATLNEARDILLLKGARDILAFDGGGSTALVIKKRGQASILNRPIHTRIPGRERPVANHIGFKFKKHACP